MRLTWLAILVVGGCAYNSAANRAYQQAELDLRAAEDARLTALRQRVNELASDRTWVLCMKAARKEALTVAQQEYVERYCPSFVPIHAAAMTAAEDKANAVGVQVASRRQETAYVNAADAAAYRRRVGAAMMVAGQNMQQASRPPVTCRPNPLALTPGELICQ